jgi:hypothetical protein
VKTREGVETEDDGTVDEVPVTLGVFGASPAAAVATVRRRSLASRAGRAGRALGIAWLLAFPAIFFPVVHFVLVPGLLVGGLVLAAMRRRARPDTGRPLPDPSRGAMRSL